VKVVGVDSIIRRPLQGQSPYIINMGLQYYAEKPGLTLSVLFNRVGRRISEVGTDGFANVWENPRSILDLQVGKVFFKKLEVKAGIADLFANDYISFQDLSPNGGYNADTDSKWQKVKKQANDLFGGYDKEKDQLMSRRKVGRNFNFTVSYKF
jgi:hypothetical protein